MTQAKILTIDLETAPIKSHHWGLWDQNIGLNMIDTDWTILSYAAKWLHEDRTMYKDTFFQRDQRKDLALLKTVRNLLNEADIVVGQNVQRFDLKKLNARFILNGIAPPSPVRIIDTLKVAKRHFAFTSNKLEYMSDKLCVKYKKLKHGQFPGFELWAEFLKRNPLAQAEMEKYNRYDVLSTEELYLIMRPWIQGHPNVNLYTGVGDIDGKPFAERCPHCGSSALKKKGFRFTQLGQYQRYHCGGCGAWPHGRTNLIPKAQRAALIGNVA
ncbi:DNA polymerase exonuclease subunit [Variovorax phage VAC_51]|uniref:DNA polymerase exonuclease subunit n=1 Tax=Variovorax phage VAC_51 TaxID=2985242 RepID=A0A9N6WX03_9CAUD|nr:DNA polymerase exonuclease subunit [Variovorax phage VAC_51]